MTLLLRWKWIILAPMFGVLLAFAFAPYDHGYLGLLTLVFFYSFCVCLPARQAALVAYLFGLGLFGSGIWWLYVSIHDFGGADAVSSGLLTSLLVGLWAMFPALVAGIFSRLSATTGRYSRVLGFGLLWVAVEYLRGYWVLNGFPWLQLAYSQLYTPLAGFVPIGGVYAVGFLLSLSAGIIVEMWRGQWPKSFGAMILLMIWAGGGVLRSLPWTHAVGEPITVTLVQGNIDQKQKWLSGQRQQTLSLYRQLTEQHWDSDVIVWPETAIPAFLSEVDEAFLKPLAVEASQHGAELVVSLPTRGKGKDYYNSVMTLGDEEAFYHKNHLLPFGEYLPLQPLSGWLLDQLQIPLGTFSAGGDKQPLLKAAGHFFVTTICYEDAFGDLVSRQVEQAAYLVNVTNDGWFGDTAEPYQHMRMAQVRALETGRYMARATNTGLTGFISPDGGIIKQAPLYKTTTLTAAIVPMAGLTPYSRWGDRIVFAFLLMLVVLAKSLEVSAKRYSRSV